MKLKRTRPILLVVLFGLAAVYALLGYMGTSLALAHGPEAAALVDSSSAEQSQTSSQGPFLTDDLSYAGHIPILDSSGRLIAYGEYRGELRCEGRTCSQGATLSYLNAQGVVVTVTYNFMTLKSAGAEEERVVVEGVGASTRLSPDDQFIFTATVQSNGDDTVSITYDASIPGASFILPSVPGAVDCQPVLDVNGDFVWICYMNH